MSEDTAIQSRKPTFPFSLVFRWLVSAVLVLLGLWRTFMLVRLWSYWTDRTIIDATYSPYPWLVVELSVLAAGVLLAVRSKWVFIPVILHIVIFARQLIVGLGSASLFVDIYAIWCAELITLAFCAWLWVKGRLR